jgi:hypothetical protein
MKPSLPLGAEKIGCIWPIEEGGFVATAKTDATGKPIIGISSLNPDGKLSGQDTGYAYQHLIIRIVVGYDDKGRAI